MVCGNKESLLMETYFLTKEMFMYCLLLSRLEHQLMVLDIIKMEHNMMVKQN